MKMDRTLPPHSPEFEEGEGASDNGSEDVMDLESKSRDEVQSDTVLGSVKKDDTSSSKREERVEYASSSASE